MSRSSSFIAYLIIIFLCSTGISAGQEEKCEADPAWLPQTPAPTNSQPEDPLADCSAYRWAWQTFLYITQRNESGALAFLSYPRIPEGFGESKSPEIAAVRPLSLLPRSGLLVGDKIQQAASNGVLVDQNGNPVYYAMHVNDVFVKFVESLGLTTNSSLFTADPLKVFPKGSLELKSAWQIVDFDAPPSDYITAKAQVPMTRVVNGEVVADPDHMRDVMVALLGMHVVGVIENHPEFIWASFEHVNIAPSAASNPASFDLNKGVSGQSFPLYAPGTPGKESNILPTNFTFDKKSQRLSPPTSIYRAFPGSSDKAEEEDEGVKSLNDDVVKLFPVGDPRAHYRLLGATWLRNGAADFLLNANFSQSASLAGENAMSNVSLESFTQVGQQNCFSCHDTAGVAGRPPLKINMSHVFSHLFPEQ